MTRERFFYLLREHNESGLKTAEIAELLDAVRVGLPKSVPTPARTSAPPHNLIYRGFNADQY